MAIASSGRVEDNDSCFGGRGQPARKTCGRWTAKGDFRPQDLHLPKAGNSALKILDLFAFQLSGSHSDLYRAAERCKLDAV
jgi:hypothetical protein